MSKDFSTYPAWTLKRDAIQDWAYFDDALTVEQCEDIIDYSKGLKLEDGTTGDNNLFQLRKSKVVFLPPTQFMEPYYHRLSGIILSLNDQFFNFDLHGFTEHLQFAEYESPGGKYDSHVDRGMNIPVRKLSIVVQLTNSDDYEGGDLELLTSIETPFKLPRKQGTLFAFPSFQLHRVTPMISGTRNSLVGWISGKQFR
jgi:PKHD-type hydroxylase